MCNFFCLSPGVWSAQKPQEVGGFGNIFLMASTESDFVPLPKLTTTAAWFDEVKLRAKA